MEHRTKNNPDQIKRLVQSQSQESEISFLHVRGSISRKSAALQIISGDLKPNNNKQWTVMCHKFLKDRPLDLGEQT